MSQFAKAGKFLTFQIKGKHYGVPIERVREINSMIEVTPVPQAPGYVKGVINLRGKVVPVIDLRLRLGMESDEYTRDTCIVVIDANVGQLGVIVDQVREVQDFTEEQIEPPPSLGNQYADEDFLIGIGKVEDHVIMLIDLLDALSPDLSSNLAKQAPNAEDVPSSEAA